jgi:hypothetical protein
MSSISELAHLVFDLPLCRLGRLIDSYLLGGVDVLILLRANATFVNSIVCRCRDSTIPTVAPMFVSLAHASMWINVFGYVSKG